MRPAYGGLTEHSTSLQMQLCQSLIKMSRLLESVQFFPLNLLVSH